MKGAIHIAADEGPRPSDRAIHMALGRQVQHQVGIGLPHRRRRGLSIGKIHPQQLVAPSAAGPKSPQHQLNAAEIAGVTGTSVDAGTPGRWCRPAGAALRHHR